MTENAKPAAQPAAKPASAPKSANADLANQIVGSNTRMIWLPMDDLDEAEAEKLARGDPPLKAEYDAVRELWAVSLASPT